MFCVTGMIFIYFSHRIWVLHHEATPLYARSTCWTGTRVFSFRSSLVSLFVLSHIFTAVGVYSNDNEPKFSTNIYAASLGEDVAVGYPVVQTQAYDPEGRIVYSIKNQSTTMNMIPFAIDADTGW